MKVTGNKHSILFVKLNVGVCLSRNSQPKRGIGAKKRTQQNLFISLQKKPLEKMYKSEA